MNERGEKERAQEIGASPNPNSSCALVHVPSLALGSVQCHLRGIPRVYLGFLWIDRNTAFSLQAANIVPTFDIVESRQVAEIAAKHLECHLLLIDFEAASESQLVAHHAQPGSSSEQIRK